MIDWPLAFSTISQALKLMDEFRKIDKELSEADLKLKIVDLTTALANLKLTLIDAQYEASEKDKEIERIKSVNKRVADDLVEHRGYLYRTQPDSDKPAGNPFCPVCYQKHGLLFETSDTHIAGRPRKCPHCDAMYMGMTTFIN
jgi:hypothetical protein